MSWDDMDVLQAPPAYPPWRTTASAALRCVACKQCCICMLHQWLQEEDFAWPDVHTTLAFKMKCKASV